MRNLMNKLGDRLVNRLVPRTTASASAYSPTGFYKYCFCRCSRRERIGAYCDKPGDCGECNIVMERCTCD